MSTLHTVRPGETMSGIASMHAVRDWRDLYYHPENAPLRAKRPDPNRIFPGDVVRVPAGPLPKANLPPSAPAKPVPATPPPTSVDPRMNETPTQFVADAKPLVVQLVAGGLGALMAIKPVLESFPAHPTMMDIARLNMIGPILSAVETHFHFNRSNYQLYLDTVISHFRTVAGNLSRYDALNQAVDMATANADFEIADFSKRHPPPAYTQRIAKGDRKDGCFYTPFFREYSTSADPSWQGSGPKTRAATVLHEMFHLLCESMWDDQSYIWQTGDFCTKSPNMCRRHPPYESLPADKAIHNPDSHAYFAVQVTFGLTNFTQSI